MLDHNIVTPIDLVEKLQAHYGGVSVYRVAKELGLSNPRVLNWMHGRACPSPKEGKRIAEILGLDVAFVLASLEAQRQSEPDLAEVWQELADCRSREIAA